jgi:hypothetical protein
MSEARINDVVETFYDQSIPSRYRLYPEINDEEKKISRNDSLKEGGAAKGNTLTNFEEGIQVSG